MASIVAPSLSLRIDFDARGRIGPGKIELLEKVAACGSIIAAARAMNMSYRHAWILVEEVETVFGKPVLKRQTGGRRGGGSSLSEFGRILVSRYRAVERAASTAAQDDLAALQVEIEPNRPADEDSPAASSP